MVLIKQNIMDHHDQQVVYKSNKNKKIKDLFVFCYKTLSLTFLGRVGISEKKKAMGDPLFTNNMMQNA